MLEDLKAMNLANLNQWLTLLANIGVLAGIIFVGVELQQTQTAMQAEASNMRTLMAIDTVMLNEDIGFGEILEKLNSGIELSEEEISGLRRRMARQLRYFENLHYQWELGVLDEEIWEANLTGISFLHSNPAFNMFYSDWPDSFGARTFRKSFVDLVLSFKN